MLVFLIVFEIFIIFIVLIISFSFIFSLKREIRSISKQVENIDKKNSDVLINISLSDKDLFNLAFTINKKIVIQKNMNHDILQRETILKNSIANISNNLKTPLNSIIDNIEMLKNAGLIKEQNDYYKLLIKESNYLKNLVQGIFNLSYLESQNKSPNIEKIELEKFILNWLSENVEFFKKINVIPAFNVLNSFSYILADRFILKQIFQNLFINAINYGTGDIFISISKKNYIELIICNSISDSSKIKTHELFEKFYVNDLSDFKYDTGLGLPTVKFLTEKINAKIKTTINDKKFEVILSFEDFRCFYFKNQDIVNATSKYFKS